MKKYISMLFEYLVIITLFLSAVKLLLYFLYALNF